MTRFESEVVVEAPREAAWKAVTTVEGIRGWLAPGGLIELRIGGPFELWFTPEAADKGMTGTRILSFLAGDLISYSGEMPTTWTVWRFEAWDRRARGSGSRDWAPIPAGPPAKTSGMPRFRRCSRG